jgi:hypothetical protein
VTRRAVLAGSVAAAALPSRPAPAWPAAAGGFRSALTGLRLTVGPLPQATDGAAASLDLGGALLVAPYGGLSWYFANLGLGFAVPHLSPAELETVVLPHLDAYLRNLTSDLNALDVAFPTWAGPVTPTSWARPVRDRDSDDSYAATALSLAARGLRRLLASTTHRDAALAWWDARGATLVAVARANLVDQVKRDDLTATFRRDLPVPDFVGSRAEASIGYLMDNTEVHRGLADLSGLLDLVGDLTGSSVPHADLDRAVDRVGHGIGRLFDARSRVYRPSDAHRSFRRTPARERTAFYPWVTAQVFPALMEVHTEDHRVADAWRFVEAHDHRWSRWPHGADPGRPDAYPWSLLALAATRRARALRRTHPAEAARLARQARRLVGAVRLALAERRDVVTVSELGASWAAAEELAGAGW